MVRVEQCTQIDLWSLSLLPNTLIDQQEIRFQGHVEVLKMSFLQEVVIINVVLK